MPVRAARAGTRLLPVRGSCWFAAVGRVLAVRGRCRRRPCCSGWSLARAVPSVCREWPVSSRRHACEAVADVDLHRETGVRHAAPDPGPDSGRHETTGRVRRPGSAHSDRGHRPASGPGPSRDHALGHGPGPPRTRTCRRPDDLLVPTVRLGAARPAQAHPGLAHRGPDCRTRACRAPADRHVRHVNPGHQTADPNHRSACARYRRPTALRPGRQAVAGRRRGRRPPSPRQRPPTVCAASGTGCRRSAASRRS